MADAGILDIHKNFIWTRLWHWPPVSLISFHVTLLWPTWYLFVFDGPSSLLNYLRPLLVRDLLSHFDMYVLYSGDLKEKKLLFQFFSQNRSGASVFFQQCQNTKRHSISFEVDLPFDEYVRPHHWQEGQDGHNCRLHVRDGRGGSMTPAEASIFPDLDLKIQTHRRMKRKTPVTSFPFNRATECSRSPYPVVAAVRLQCNDRVRFDARNAGGGVSPQMHSWPRSALYLSAVITICIAGMDGSRPSGQIAMF